ncbi:hypothetical protein MWH25_07205 [Natroniella acetigena]|uniref:transposase n=1 Tax=Natroniella acetigena TaxID=52004 RepID=UPI00200ABC70|nr:transposase [Natroniella acetigena]MCK8827528.1 hypothetical protein [Natroniella acetigena]
MVRNFKRLEGYDYSRAGAYFVTICTKDKRCLFGDVIEGKVRLNDAESMIKKVWIEIPENYFGVKVDEFVIMPNHLHGIILLDNEDVGAGPCACPGESYAHNKQG